MRFARAVGIAAATLLAAGASAAGQDPARADASSALSKCPVAEDAEYGYSTLKPVEIGGGPMYVAARERRYLDALRGPAGEPLQYKRLGSLSQNPPNSMVILDRYEVTYAGLAKPVSIYLNAYHYDDRFRAPQGFTCGTPVQLLPPGPDPLLTEPELITLAIEQGATRQFDSIPLGSDKMPNLGVILDQFRLVAAESRAAAARGARIGFDRTSGGPPPAPLRQRMIVVAHPLPCEARSIPPKAIAIVPPPNGAPTNHDGDFVTGEALRTLVPGLTPPDGSLAATYRLSGPRQRDAIRITYAEACGDVAEVSLPLVFTPHRPLSMPDPALPAGISNPGNVYLQVQIDLDGRLQRPLHIGGPPQLLAAALEAIKGWTAEPARVNGAPISTAATVRVTFTPPVR